MEIGRVDIVFKSKVEPWLSAFIVKGLLTILFPKGVVEKDGPNSFFFYTSAEAKKKIDEEGVEVDCNEMFHVITDKQDEFTVVMGERDRKLVTKVIETFVHPQRGLVFSVER